LIVYHDARIDPGSAFRLVVKVSRYVADGEYGLVDMSEQHHHIWFDRDSSYSLAQFHEDLSSKIIWGPLQTLSVWVVDQDTGSEWRLRRDEHVQQMVKDRWADRLAFLNVEVVNKNLCNDNDSSAASKGGRCVSGVTSGNEPNTEPVDVEGFGDTCSTPTPPPEVPVAIDWTTLVIQEKPDDDGTATQLVDEEQIYEAMGFQQAEATQEQGGTEEVPIPAIPPEVQQEMNEAAVDVDDTADEEPLYEWDRNNPDMSVGICYPNIDELRLAVRQHAIKKEFELQTEHSDRDRYRVRCGARGCPWRLVGKTQHDGSCRVHFLQ